MSQKRLDQWEFLWQRSRSGGQRECRMPEVEVDSDTDGGSGSGKGSAAVTATMTHETAGITGTVVSSIFGSLSNDTITVTNIRHLAYYDVCGGDGNDTIVANGGFGNLLRGESGDDRLTGGDGDDYYLGGAGEDRLVLTVGTDNLIGGYNDVYTFVFNVAADKDSNRLSDFEKSFIS